jgi:hypothetical protein
MSKHPLTARIARLIAAVQRGTLEDDEVNRLWATSKRLEYNFYESLFFKIRVVLQIVKHSQCGDIQNSKFPGYFQQARIFSRDKR